MYFFLNKLVIILFFFLSIQSNSGFSALANEINVIAKNEIIVDNDSIVGKSLDKNFKSKYKSSEFIYEYKTPESTSWDRFKDWLAGIFRNLFSNLDKEKSVTVVYYLVRFLAIIMVIIVVYFIVKAILNKEGNWIFGRNSNKNIDNYSDLEKNLHLVDFEKLIEKTLQSDQNRLCIRYYYLWYLKKLSSKQIIAWDLEKTNADYLYEIKNPVLKTEFDYMSYLYNNIWYGEFEFNEETFDKAKNAFEKAIKSLGNV